MINYDSYKPYTLTAADRDFFHSLKGKTILAKKDVLYKKNSLVCYGAQKGDSISIKRVDYYEDRFAGYDLLLDDHRWVDLLTFRSKRQFNYYFSVK